MASWGNTDFAQLKRLQEKMERLQKAELDAFCEDCVKDLAKRVLAGAKKNTPTRTGHLRRHWTVKQGKRNGKYTAVVLNPVKYASYVEYGHRKRNHKGWTTGRFMLTNSTMLLESKAQSIVNEKLKRKLGEVFDGK